jgi:galactoside O-acetyltransferase
MNEFKSIGEDVFINDNCIIKRPHLCEIGSHVAIDNGVTVSTQLIMGDYNHKAPFVVVIGGEKSKLILEDFSFVASGTKIVCGSEDYTGVGLVGPTIPEKYRVINHTTVKFEIFAGCGVNCTIMPGVTLAEGFDAGDLRVFLTAYKPLGTDIKVYYKVKAADDSEPFADKSYVLMNQKTRSSSYSSVNNFNDSIEYEFEPFDATNSISYSTSTTTYTTFNQFAFKIALLTDDTSKVPIIYDMRAIALPAMST